MAAVSASSCSSNLTPSLDTSICHRCGPKKKKKKKREREKKRKGHNTVEDNVGNDVYNLLVEEYDRQNGPSKMSLSHFLKPVSILFYKAKEKIDEECRVGEMLPDYLEKCNVIIRIFIRRRQEVRVRGGGGRCDEGSSGVFVRVCLCEVEREGRGCYKNS